MNDKQNIEIDEQLLRNYLEGNLSQEDQHKVEKTMMDSSFLSDALDGLFSVSNNKQASAIIDQLNNDITQKTRSKANKIKFNELIPDIQTLVLSITIVILLLAIVGFVLYKMSLSY